MGVMQFVPFVMGLRTFLFVFVFLKKYIFFLLIFFNIFKYIHIKNIILIFSKQKHSKNNTTL